MGLSVNMVPPVTIPLFSLSPSKMVVLILHFQPNPNIRSSWFGISFLFPMKSTETLGMLIAQPSLNHPMNPTNPSKSSEIPSIADGETYIPHIYTYITYISRKSQSFHGQLSSFSCLRIISSGLKRSYEGADAVTPWAVGARYRRSPGERASA